MYACSQADEMTKVIFRPEAAADVAMAAGWYDLQQLGLGESFLAEVRDLEIVKIPFALVDIMVVSCQAEL